MFYNTGVADEYGFIQKFYDQTLYDEETINSGTQTVSTDSGPVTFPVGGSPYVYPGTELDQANFEGGYYIQVPALSLFRFNGTTFYAEIPMLAGQTIVWAKSYLFLTDSAGIASYASKSFLFNVYYSK
jgi:hypothetical protein